MKKTALLFLFISCSVFSQNINKLKKSALQQAKEFSEASLEQNYDGILNYTHPKLIKKFGKEKLRTDIEDVFRTMNAQKIKILESKVNEVADIKKEGKEIRCLVLNTQKMSFSGRKVTRKSSLFGFYDKQKEQWYFIEAQELLSNDDIRSAFGSFKTEISIPADEHISDNE